MTLTGRPTMSHTATTTVTTVLLVVAATSLTGCSQIGGFAHGESTTHAATRSDLADAPTWVPDDATDITVVTGTRGSGERSAPSSMVFRSEDGVVSGLCERLERGSAPTMHVAGAPDPYASDEVTKCGAWSMIANGDRWLAWTPNPNDGE